MQRFLQKAYQFPSRYYRTIPVFVKDHLLCDTFRQTTKETNNGLMSQHKTRLIHTSNNSHKSPRLEALKRQIFYLLTMKSQAILFLLLALVIGETRGQDINPLSLCGPTDDRVLSQDIRQGRIMPVGCTAWMISESVFLTAAHCQENVKVMHFTFGSSDAPLEDQYEVESFVKSPNYTNSPKDIQHDWLVGRLLPNSITSKTPGVAQSEKCNKTGCGWYTLGEVPDEPEGNTITVTGYGQLFDPRNKSAQNQTTHTGRLVNTTTILIYKPDTTVSLFTKLYYANYMYKF